MYAFWSRRFKPIPLQPMNFPKMGLRDHVVIAGGGRVGKYIARVMHQMRVPFVMLEINSRRVEEIQASGFPILFGDATKETILEAAEINRANLLLITTPVTIISRAIVEQARKFNLHISIIARAESLEQMQELQELGVQHVIQPEFEASLEFAHQALFHLHVPSEQIEKITEDARQKMRQILSPK